MPAFAHIQSMTYNKFFIKGWTGQMLVLIKNTGTEEGQCRIKVYNHGTNELIHTSSWVSLKVPPGIPSQWPFPFYITINQATLFTGRVETYHLYGGTGYLDETTTWTQWPLEVDECLTCAWVTGYNNHGPLKTQFELNETVYAYCEIHGHGGDLYGWKMRHEWWYKKTGESEFTKRWTWTSNPCEGHYTEWASWSWKAIGSDYGPGEGYVKLLVCPEGWSCNDVDWIHFGTTNNFTIKGAPPKVFADIISLKYPGTFKSGDTILVGAFVKNTGDTDASIKMEFYNDDTGALMCWDEWMIVYPQMTVFIDCTFKINQNSNFHGRAVSYSKLLGGKYGDPDETMYFLIEFVGETTGSIAFQEESAKVGDVIHADCMWNNAQWNYEYMAFATMWIIDPEKINRATKYAQEPTGTHVSQATVDKVGQWIALLWVWTGTQWLVYEDLIQVTPSCADYKTQPECENAGCYWYNNSCHSTDIPECEKYTTQVECETAKCFWYSYPNPFGEPSCHTQDMIMAYLPIIIAGVGGTLIIAALVSKPKPPYYPPPPRS